MFRTLLIIGTGGFLGSIGRYLVQLGAGKVFSPSFPAGTFFANIIGCLIIGMVYAMAEKGNLLSAEMRLFLTVGFCGGFTTFSSFANENLMLLKEGSIGFLLLNVVGSIVVGIFAVYLGIVFIRSII